MSITGYKQLPFQVNKKVDFLVKLACYTTKQTTVQPFLDVRQIKPSDIANKFKGTHVTRQQNNNI